MTDTFLSSSELVHFWVNWILTEAELRLKFHKYVSEFPQHSESGEPMLFHISTPQTDPAPPGPQTDL